MTRATNYSMDLEMVGIGEPTADLNLDMHCAKVGGDTSLFNWSIEQCILRVKVNNPCISKCPHGIKIKEQLEKAGVPYRLEAFPGISVGDKTKWKGEPAQDPDAKWPVRNRARNMRISRDFLNGMSADSMEQKYLMGRTGMRKIVYTYCEIVNMELCSKCEKGANRGQFLKVHSKAFLPHLFLVNDTEDPLKGD